MPSKLPVIAVRLSAEEKAAVERAAKSDDRSVCWWVRNLIRKALKVVK